MGEDVTRSSGCATMTALALKLHQSAANRSAFDRSVRFMPLAFIRRTLELLRENGLAVVPLPYSSPLTTSVDLELRREALRTVMYCSAQAAVELAADRELTQLPRDYATELYEKRHEIARRIAANLDDAGFLRESPQHALLIGGV